VLLYQRLHLLESSSWYAPVCFRGKDQPKDEGGEQSMRDLLKGNELRSISFPSCTRFTECFERVATRARWRERKRKTSLSPFSFLLPPGLLRNSIMATAQAILTLRKQLLSAISDNKVEVGWFPPFWTPRSPSLPPPSPVHEASRAATARVGDACYLTGA